MAKDKMIKEPENVDGLKQRIIGALVLISLAVIFVPMVFDEPHSERTSTSINIPEEPPFPEVDIPESDLAAPPPYRQDTAADDGSSGQGFRILENEEVAATPPPTQVQQNQPQPETVKPVSPEVAEKQPAVSQAPDQTVAPEPKPEQPGSSQSKAEFTRSLEGAWVVQLASFGNPNNARRLRDKVRKEGFSSHLQEVVRGDATYTRVFSGPFAEKSEAEAAKSALDKAFGLNSLVTSGGK